MLNLLSNSDWKYKSKVTDKMLKCRFSDGGWYQEPFKCYFFPWNLTPTHPTPHNVELYTFVTFFPEKLTHTPPPRHYATLEWPVTYTSTDEMRILYKITPYQHDQKRTKSTCWQFWTTPNVSYLLVETVEERATADTFVDEHQSLEVVRLTQAHQQQDVWMSQPPGNIKICSYIARYAFTACVGSYTSSGKDTR